MTELVRSAVLSHYIEVARTAGLDPYAMVQSVGLSPRCLAEPELKIATSAVRRLLEQSAAVSGLENFGLRMAEKRRLSVLGPMGMLARDAPSLRAVLDIIIRHMHLHNESLHLHVEDANGIATIRLDLVIKERGAMHQSVELTLGALMRVMRVFLPTEWTPHKVCFVHQRPQDTSLHRKLFGPALAFGAEFDGILCKSSELDAPIAASDPVMAAYARRQLESTTPLSGQSMEREIRQLVLILLPCGRCSVDNVARHLNVDRRTVHRQLAKDAQTFSALVDTTRQQLSERYLGLGSHTLAEISNLLGFSVPSAYTRWHQSRYGVAPSAKRRELHTTALQSAPDFGLQ